MINPLHILRRLSARQFSISLSDFSVFATPTRHASL
jgi:hypothetical protein